MVEKLISVCSLHPDASHVELRVLNWLHLQGICCRFDLPHSAKAEELKIGRPEKLLVVARIDQLFLDVSNRGLDVTDELASVATLQLSDLRLVVKDGVFEDLLNILVADFGRLLSR